MKALFEYVNSSFEKVILLLLHPVIKVSIKTKDKKMKKIFGLWGVET